MNTARRLLLAAGGAALLALAAPSRAIELSWSLRLYGSDQIEVLVDTTALPGNAVIEEARFSVVFADDGNRALGQLDLSYLDARLPALSAGHVYQRRFRHSFAHARRVSSDRLEALVRAGGGKADGEQAHAPPVPISASGSGAVSRAPDVVIDAPQAVTGVMKPLPLVLLAKQAPNPAVRRCRIYADIAVAQNEAAIGNRCGFEGPMWSSRYGYHFDWCVNVSAEHTREGTRARQRLLEQCAP